MKSISAVILNDHNRNIKKTLDSLKWCDEIIVWTKPINGDWAKARNEAMATAKNEWVLFIDSDEEFNGKIPNVAGMTGYDGFYLRRRDIFWGKELRHGETESIKLLRLAKKSAGEWQRKVHEVWKLKTENCKLKIGELKASLMHYPHPTISEFLDSINRYTDIDILEQKNFRYFRLIFNPPGKFIYNYFLKLGFLDGWPGLVYAFMMSFHSLLVRVKMWESHGL